MIPKDWLCEAKQLVEFTTCANFQSMTFAFFKHLIHDVAIRQMYLVRYDNDPRLELIWACNVRFGPILNCDIAQSPFIIVHYDEGFGVPVVYTFCIQHMYMYYLQAYGKSLSYVGGAQRNEWT